MPEKEFNIRSENNAVVIEDSLVLDIPSGRNIMILEDKFKSSYDCKTCEGTGEVKVSCLKCEGQGRAYFADANGMVDCPRCDGAGFRTETCKDCRGKGMLLEIPDIAKARPTSGAIVAMGPDVTIWELGDRVAYSGYTGHLLPFKSNTRLRIMAENEPFCRIRTVPGKDKQATNIEFVDKDTAYDLT